MYACAALLLVSPPRPAILLQERPRPAIGAVAHQVVIGRRERERPADADEPVGLLDLVAQFSGRETLVQSLHRLDDEIETVVGMPRERVRRGLVVRRLVAVDEL